MRYNKLSSLPSEIGQLTSLTSLFLEANQLPIPSKILETQNPYKILNYQVLEKIKEAKEKNLTVLDLTDLEIKQLPSEIGQLTNLTELYLGGNQISSLPKEIGQLTKLTILGIGGNQLTSLPPEIEKLTNLTKLGIVENKLSSLPSVIEKLTNLTELYLRGNQLPIPSEILDTKNPHEILPYYKVLEKIKKAKEKKLTVLDLKNTGIYQLPSEIGDLTSLTTLDLSNNHLRSLPVEIGQLTNLIKLNLVNNNLTYLPVEIIQLRQLNELYLPRNKLPLSLSIMNKDAQSILKHYSKKYIIGEKYIIESLLGKGGQGEVYKVRHNGKLRALKKIKYSKKDAFMKKIIGQEIKTLRKLSNHDSHLKYYGAKKDKKTGAMLIITTYANNGDLLKYIERNKAMNKVIEEFEALDILLQIAKALKYAHDFNPAIIHRDIKPENILSNKIGHNLTWYLCDWGIAKEKKKSELTISINFSPAYISPEVFNKGIRHKEADIYALGMTFYYMLFGRQAFNKDAWLMYFPAHLNEKVEIPKGCSKKIEDLVLSMVEKEHEERFTVDKVIEEAERLLKEKSNKTPPKSIWKFWI